MRKVFWIGASAKCEVPKAHPEWVKEFWPKLACPECSTLWPHEEAQSIHVVVADDARMKRHGPTGGTGRPHTVNIIERSLAEHLGLPAPGFAVGDVVQRGRVLPDYWTLTCARQLRIPQWGDERARYSNCGTCGRRFEHIPWGKTWIRNEDLKKINIFGSCAGTGPYVTDDVWFSKQLWHWRDIQTKEVAVRDSA